jgi:integrase
VVAREWLAKFSAIWAENHGDRIVRRFERDIFPWIGGRPVAEITAPEVLAAVRRIESRGALETAHRALSNCGQVSGPLMGEQEGGTGRDCWLIRVGLKPGYQTTGGCTLWLAAPSG